MDERELIYDWNRVQAPFDWSRARVDLNDETLRDGLQSPSVRDPSLEVKKRLLHLMADLGIVAADLGLPGAGPRVVDQVRHEVEQPLLDLERRVPHRGRLQAVAQGLVVQIDAGTGPVEGGLHAVPVIDQLALVHSPSVAMRVTQVK